MRLYVTIVAAILTAAGAIVGGIAAYATWPWWGDDDFRHPKRGDLVAHAPMPLQRTRCGVNPDSVVVLRVVGLPGETFEMRSGHVYVNGVRLEEPYVTSFVPMTFSAKEIPQDSYFVLGDDRQGSCDSRVYGPVPRFRLVEGP